MSVDDPTFLSKEAQCGRSSREARAARKRKAREDKLAEYTEAEATLQGKCNSYLMSLEPKHPIRWFHIPESISSLMSPMKRVLNEAEKAEARYMLADIPDVVVFCFSGRYPRALIVELKVGLNKPTPGQRQYLCQMYGGKIPSFSVCRSVGEFMATVDNFIANCRQEWVKQIKG